MELELLLGGLTIEGWPIGGNLCEGLILSVEYRGEEAKLITWILLTSALIFSKMSS